MITVLCTGYNIYTIGIEKEHIFCILNKPEEVLPISRIYMVHIMGMCHCQDFLDQTSWFLIRMKSPSTVPETSSSFHFKSVEDLFPQRKWISAGNWDISHNCSQKMPKTTMILFLLSKHLETTTQEKARKWYSTWTSRSCWRKRRRCSNHCVHLWHS